MKIRTFAWIIFATLVLYLTAHESRAQMTVHSINVGQGDATLLEFKSAAVLVDAGGQDAKSGDDLIQYLKSFFERRTDLVDSKGKGVLYSVITTHPHIDHNRSLMRVLTTFKVRNLVDNGGANPGPGLAPVTASRDYAKKHKILYNKIPDVRVGPQGYTTPHLRALSASPSDVNITFLNGFANCEDPNNDSAVVMVDYKGARVLIAGDAEWDKGDESRCTPAARKLVQRFGSSGMLKADVYKVGHHGSANGTSAEYLAAMQPSIAVMTAGHHSFRAPKGFDAFHFGHPREVTVAALESAIERNREPISAYTFTAIGPKKGLNDNRKIDKAIYCSCWDGNVVISFDEAGQNVEVTTQK